MNCTYHRNRTRRTLSSVAFCVVCRCCISTPRSTHVWQKIARDACMAKWSSRETWHGKMRIWWHACMAKWQDGNTHRPFVHDFNGQCSWPLLNGKIIWHKNGVRMSIKTVLPTKPHKKCRTQRSPSSSSMVLTQTINLLLVIEYMWYCATREHEVDQTLTARRNEISQRQETTFKSKLKLGHDH